MKDKKETWIDGVRATHYTSAGLFNLVVWAIIYHFLGWQWFWVFVVADVTRDLYVIIRRLYSPYYLKIDKNL
jgi:hypothetical protein